MNTHVEDKSSVPASNLFVPGAVRSRAGVEFVRAPWSSSFVRGGRVRSARRDWVRSARPNWLRSARWHRIRNQSTGVQGTANANCPGGHWLGFAHKIGDPMKSCGIQERNCDDRVSFPFQTARPNRVSSPNNHKLTFVRDFMGKAHWLRFGTQELGSFGAGRAWLIRRGGDGPGGNRPAYMARLAQ